jgi:electron transport complex protein RnfG
MKMTNIVKSTLIMALITFVASMALSHINKITLPNIQRQEREKQESALKTVLPGYRITEKKTADTPDGPFTYWIGEKQREETVARGYAFITEKSGYSGPVRSMVGIDERGTVLGIVILQQTETPGLGARCIERASTETFFDYILGRTAPVKPPPPWFQVQFTGLDATKKIEILKRGDWTPSLRDELIEKNAISAITGATITSRTVRDSISMGMEKLTALF